MKNKIEVVESEYQLALAIPGITFRSFQGPADFPAMLDVLHGCKDADGLERAENMDDITNTYSHLHHCDPGQDMLMVEVGGRMVGYTRVWWERDGSGSWVGFHFGNVLPEWRRRGIGTRLLQFDEDRLHQIAALLIETGQMPGEIACLYDCYTSDSEVHRKYLLERHGYQPARYTYQMVRASLENIPDMPLPPGVELRPVEQAHLRLIWEASNEAFRDHWGYIPDPWESFQQMVSDPDFDPSLWQVAWQGDQIAGMVLCFINKDENEIYGRKRGFTENICVRRPWRRQGLAKALIARGFISLKEHGMSEAALGVDTQNTSGALHLYESMGFQVERSGTLYRKPVNVNALSD